MDTANLRIKKRLYICVQLENCNKKILKRCREQGSAKSYLGLREPRKFANKSNSERRKTIYPKSALQHIESGGNPENYR